MVTAISSEYKNLIIYYFSGTGNARNAANWILEIAQNNGISSQLVNIDRLGSIEDLSYSQKTLVGFCFPTHGFNMPPIMLKFIMRFPHVQKLDAFILNTRAGMKMSTLFIPGLSGAAQLLPAAMLRYKGFSIVGMQPLDLPSNWIFLHPGLKQKVIDSIYSRCHKIVNKFALKVLSGKKSFKALISVPIDILLLPIAIGYYFVGRFFLAKTLIATNDCNACEKCVDQCPVEAIKMIHNKPFWKYSCESCMRCVNACPQRAIETTQTFSTILLLLSSLVVTPLLIGGLELLGIWELFTRNAFSEKTWSIINAVIFLLFVFISYRILHFLMKYKIINDLITYTSFSSYKFWRRYKAPKHF